MKIALGLPPKTTFISAVNFPPLAGWPIQLSISYTVKMLSSTPERFDADTILGFVFVNTPDTFDPPEN